MDILAFVEALFLVFALGSIGLTFGIKGADFTAARRARMIRQEWSLISFFVCILAGLAILAPLAPYILSKVASSFISIPWTIGPVELTISVVISGVIAAVLAAIFYRINVVNAKELIRKAEI
jgi:cytochrome b subunit of formate dehydrogenase